MTSSVRNQTYKLEIVLDCDVESPREHNDNFGKMVCWHRRYNLGDRHNYSDKDDFLFSLLEEIVGDTEKAEEVYEKIKDGIGREVYKSYGAYNKAADDEVLEILKQKFVILPLYLYDHSGITMNTTGFSCPWDSGQVGWIYASLEDVKKEFGDDSPSSVEKALKLLRTETELYDCYLRGECYGFRLYENGEEVDSCYGFIGSFDEVKEAIKEHLPDDAKYLADEAQYGEEKCTNEIEEDEELEM